MESLLSSIQKSCLPGVWSRGVSLVRDGAVSADVVRADEAILRVQSKDRAVAAKVTLWFGDEDYFCDCNDRADPCPHVAAAAIFMRNRPASPVATPTARIEYRLAEKEGTLLLERWLIQPGAQPERLTESLTSLVGGLQSGRISGPSLPATRSDFAVDAAWGPAWGNGPVAPARWPALLGALSDCPSVLLEGQSVTCSSKIWTPELAVEASGRGFRIRRLDDAMPARLFTNGAGLVQGVLRPVQIPALPGDLRDCMSPEGKVFPPDSSEALVAEVLPFLESKFRVHRRTEQLPELVDIAPRVVLRLTRLSGTDLSVVPVIEYGDAQALAARRQIPRKDPHAERTLQRQVQAELHLAIDQPTRFTGQDAVEFALRSKKFEVAGDAPRSFEPEPELQALIEATDSDFRVRFQSASKSGNAADPRAVFEAWRRGDAYVPLLSGGWAKLPKDWLSRFGDRVLEILAAREAKGQVPPYLLPEIAELQIENGQELADSLRRLRERLTSHDKLPEATLPSDLRAELRTYQRQGIDWLSLLRDSGLGALLADDMGLGKTLQTLCAITGKTLVICPTSVIHSWEEQIERFRPALKVCVFHGGDRELDPDADITLTTYALLRLELTRLSSVTWDTLVLDEAQTIKNPDSQAARAAFLLKGQFRIALSGTPIENRLEDLWSQMHFLNPGLLGTRQEFQERYQAHGPEPLRRKIRPFLLRRLKKDVAPELPPRTEVTLTCELSDRERSVYEALLASTRQDVLRELEQGGAVLAALEALLRLRQACCHLSLVPGQSAETSSKVELLAETLESSIPLGHRALIFSQWTSFLDLIQGRLDRQGIRWDRIDGSTRDREGVVQRFQSSEGPSVLLISLKAGGVGLTLTAADQVFIMDPWWNPAVEDQAADRAHRIGQTNPVLIHRLVAENSIEERILLLQKKKQDLARSLTGGGIDSNQAGALNRADLLELIG